MALSPTDARIARTFPSYRDFVDDALFHPTWGYYSTGVVRFGEGGHYDTFPTALSPLFGRMVARAAFRLWTRLGRPARFEICELGAGNGQLCLDTLVALDTARPTAAWTRFVAACRYRIVERSTALAARQRATLGPLAARVRWTCADLSRRTRPPARLGASGLVVANEVLDCLAHHKIVRGRDGHARVVFVVPIRSDGRAVARHDLGRVLRAGTRLRYREVALPLDSVRGLRRFLARYCRERLHAARAFPPYFACPEAATLVQNVGRLYRRAEMLWIDYGDLRPFHLGAPAKRRIFAGPPRSGHRIFDAPGRDDITFMVDFSVVAAAARARGLGVTYYGGQGALARVTGVRLGTREIDHITRARAVGWMLDVMGVGAERAWRQGGITWTRAGARGGSLHGGVARDVEEFLGRRPSRFRMMAVSTGPTIFPRSGAASRGRRTGC
jgi:SAM-dependent MidA family methyltransferase